MTPRLDVISAVGGWQERNATWQKPSCNDFFDLEKVFSD
jgi:hypothetical protein